MIKTLQLGNHLVAFLDVLGQREKFRALHHPTSPEDRAEVGEVVRQTAGFVLELRNIFDTQFTAFEAGLANLKKQTENPVRPKFMGFSDSFVTSVPIRDDDGHLALMVTIVSALSAAAGVMIVSLASGHPLRGGIDVGLAVEIGPQEIYGTALEKAYLLESQEAGYPRILIGEELWNFLSTAYTYFQAQGTPESKAITAIIEKAKRLIAIDKDGKRILDYLGPAIVENNSGLIEKSKEIELKPIYEFVLAEQERINKGNDHKLIARYQAFRFYIESRLPLWNFDVVRT
ncbi:MAG: hypothetical protein WB439_07425 [Acidobacteriaceae bacterium]